MYSNPVGPLTVDHQSGYKNIAFVFFFPRLDRFPYNLISTLINICSLWCRYSIARILLINKYIEFCIIDFLPLHTWNCYVIQILLCLCHLNFSLSEFKAVFLLDLRKHCKLFEAFGSWLNVPSSACKLCFYWIWREWEQRYTEMLLNIFIKLHFSHLANFRPVGFSISYFLFCRI